MIIDFTLENWMSFREPVSFTMEVGKSAQHSTRVPRNEKFGLNLLPVAAILGGNASGKSNFVKAFDFARSFIVNGTNGNEAISAVPFLLNEDSRVSPVKFKFRLLIDNRIFEYAFGVNREAVVSESLFELTHSGRERLFEIESASLSTHDSFGVSEELSRQIFDVKKGNQLFLTTLCKGFKFDNPVYSWFKDKVSVVTPDSDSNTHYSSYFENEDMLNTVNDLLKTLDCGVDQIEFVPFIASDTEHANFAEQLKERDFAFISQPLIFAKMVGDKIETSRLVAFHKSDQNVLSKFDLSQESGGTLQMLKLLPAFLRLPQSDTNHVLVIDEVERSLHAHMMQNLIKAYLSNCSCDSNSQLIFTTHNVQLMSERMLRTDEMWLARRNKSGESTLYSIDSFNDLENEENIVERYLTGQFGGIPTMLLLGAQLQLEETAGCQ